MAGACTAVSNDSLGAASNPASLFYAGKRYDLGVTFFNPNREFTVTGAPSGYPGTFGLAPGTVKSGSNLFLMPSFGTNWRVRENTTFGVSMYGNGGMNTTYDSPVFGQSPAGVNLMQMFITPTVTHRFAGRHSVGVSMIAAYQRFKADGLGAFSMFSSNPANLTNNGAANSMGVGGKIGYLGDWCRFFSAGAWYQSKVVMSKFDRYSGLFAGQGSFDIPPAFSFGMNVKPLTNLAVSADFERIQYSAVPAIANPMLPNLMMAQLGAATGAGFGWRDINIGRFGLQYTPVRKWTLRCGFSTGQQPIPSSEVLFNILAPGVMTKHATFGFTHAMDNGKLVHFAVVRAIPASVLGYNPLEAPGQQQVRLRMSQWEVEMGFSFGVKK